MPNKWNSRKEAIALIERIVRELENDTSLRKKAEELRKAHGTLTYSDLHITFTI